ncbi:MAG TPA: glycosyltransferase, partial [Candidatus Synoicihabitans sp.]|nr:glycosyltransferase [Candidatus Synoicihabitans sp.]
MKLLFYAPQMAAYGGMERHLCTLAAAAAARGHRIRFLTTSDSLSQELRRELTDPAIDFRELAVPRNRASPARKLLWVYAQTLRARATPWDLIYTNGQSALARVVWRAATRKARIVHHHHTAGDSAEQRSWSRRFRGVLATAPEIIGCSPATCEELNRALARSDGHFLPYLTRSAMPAAAVADRQAGRPVRIGFTGRLVVEKGIDTLLRLAERPDLSAVEWHIHGAGAAYPAERFAGRPRVSYHGAYRSAE